MKHATAAALQTLSDLLDHAATHAETRKIDPSILLNARLYPNMYNLTRQVGEANRHAMIACALLAGVDRLRRLPCAIVQGRYDIVCPIRSADDLHRAWPEADYVVVPDAGHSAREPGIARELVAATDRLKTKFA